MRIVSIQLKNIKSHRDREFTFSKGINVLSGANGSGKSTIFEAIGYALFGVNAQDFVSRADRFLTLGAKRGEISVVFQAMDGEMYRVSRTVGPAAKWLLAKEIGGAFEVEEHANAQETEQRIASLLRLSGNRSLADQFKLVIGPFQNDFLGPFVIKQPTRRQDAFDEILGIDTWRKTFDGTKALTAAIQTKMETLQAEVEGKREQVAVLPGKKDELRDLRDRLAAKRAELESRQAELDKATAEVAALDAQKEKLDAVQSEVRTLEERIVSGKDHVATQQLLTQQAKTAAEAVAAAAKGKGSYDAAEERLKVLREQEKQKLLVERNLAELEKEQSQLNATLAVETRERDELRKSLDEEGKRVAAEEKVLGAELREVVQLQSQAAENLERVTLSLRQFRELPVHGIDNVLPYLFVALDRIAALDLDAAEKRKLVEKGAAFQREAEQLAPRQRELEMIQGQRSELLGKKATLVEGRERIGAGDCPYFHEPCRNLEGGGGAEVFTSRIEALDQEVALLDARAASLAGEVAAAQSAAQEVAAAGQVRHELARLAEQRQELEQEFASRMAALEPDALVAAVAQWQEKAYLPRSLSAPLDDLRLQPAGTAQERRAMLSDWSDRWRAVTVELEEKLTALVKEAEGPARAHAVKLAELTARRQALEAKKRDVAAMTDRIRQRERSIEEHEKRRASLLDRLGSQKEALSVFAGLEEGIKAAGDELQRFQPDRDRYIANKKAADDLEKRQETLARYQSLLNELMQQLAAKREEGKALADVYQPQRHEQSKGDRERVVSLLATVKAELAGVSEGITRLQGEVAALEVIAGEIQKRLAAMEELKGQAELVKFLRNQVFKNVSAQLSERFREEISSRADRIYRCISDSDEELYWGENYQVILRDMADGAIRERSDDQLSGGQMMSAVVALRLALLQTIGARIAFFDEPTSNLDAERRENLAKAFRAIDVGQEEVTGHWYDQLFLVSHDVSFTEITDQILHLD